MKTSLILLLVFTSCSHHKHQYGDGHLSRANAPQFLIDVTPQGKDIDDVEYFVKRTPEGKTFELKYEVNKMEYSLTYSENGKFIEEEADVDFSTLSEAQQENIRNHLGQKYKKYKIHETELRTDQSGKKYIDVEVIHPEGPTGLTEFTYTMTGEYVSEKNEEMEQIDTLN